MTGGPWTRSMKVVHGPGPKWGSMDPWSMFCPHPFKATLPQKVATNSQKAATINIKGENDCDSNSPFFI